MAIPFDDAVSVEHDVMRMNGETSRGFMLIELLVVVAIISLLVSILLSSLAKAKELAKRVAYTADWHDVGIDGAMYISGFSSHAGTCERQTL